MIESGEGCLGKLIGLPSHTCSWGRSKDNTLLFYDLASLTKVVVTNSLLLDLVQDSTKSLAEFRDCKVEDFLSTAPEKIKSLKLGALWDHRAGLEAHFHLDPLKSRSAFWERVRRCGPMCWMKFLREHLR